jgi:hypothetical protein
MNSQDIIEQMNVDRHHEQAPSGFAVTCYTLATCAALYCVSVFLFSL